MSQIESQQEQIAEMTKAYADAQIELKLQLKPAFKNRENQALDAYAMALAAFRVSSSKIMREGLIVADEKGRPSPHPAMSIQKSSSADIERWLKYFKGKFL